MTTIQGPTGGRGTRAIASRSPATEGLTASTTTQKGNEVFDKPVKGWLNTRKDRVGIIHD